MNGGKEARVRVRREEVGKNEVDSILTDLRSRVVDPR